jgi:predicted nucleic acid-binding protein
MEKIKEVVANTSSIIFIAKLRIFELAKNIFNNILIPTQVNDELFDKESPENLYIKKELGNFLIEKSVNEIKDFPLDIGERAALSLCLEKNLNILLSDDKKARKYARVLKLDTIGVLGIILNNFKGKKINKNEARSLIEKLIRNDYRMSTRLYSEIIDLIEKN